MRTDLSDHETPLAVIDLDRVRSNVRRVAGYAAEHGLGWRPHVKTHKSPMIAAMQVEAGATGLTVATPREAEVMASVCDDLLLAHPPVGPKARRLMRLPAEVRLKVALDSAAVLRHLAAEAEGAGRTVGILVEVDVGMGRVGVQEGREAVELAELATGLPGARWDGILFYPGHIRVTGDRRMEMIRDASDRLGGFLHALESEGLSPGIVSGGSTPTLYESHHFQGLTEIRPGTCVFHDRDSVQLGAAAPGDVAFWVEASVVSVARPGGFVVDAGSKALAKETFRGDGGGFGYLMDAPHLRVASLSEEHGIIELPDGEGAPAVGDRVRIVPNHVCVSVNLQDRLLALETDGGLVEVPLPARGRAGG